jgi:hypothetical protein
MPIDERKWSQKQRLINKTKNNFFFFQKTTTTKIEMNRKLLTAATIIPRSISVRNKTDDVESAVTSIDGSRVFGC